MVDRIERLTNLLALLLETAEPLSLVQIASELDGQYPDDDWARRAAFERDKSVLREHRRAHRDGVRQWRPVRRADAILDRPASV